MMLVVMIEMDVIMMAVRVVMMMVMMMMMMMTPSVDRTAGKSRRVV